MISRIEIEQEIQRLTGETRHCRLTLSERLRLKSSGKLYNTRATNMIPCRLFCFWSASSPDKKKYITCDSGFNYDETYKKICPAAYEDMINGTGNFYYYILQAGKGLKSSCNPYETLEGTSNQALINTFLKAPAGSCILTVRDNTAVTCNPL